MKTVIPNVSLKQLTSKGNYFEPFTSKTENREDIKEWYRKYYKQNVKQWGFEDITSIMAEDITEFAKELHAAHIDELEIILTDVKKSWGDEGKSARDVEIQFEKKFGNQWYFYSLVYKTALELNKNFKSTATPTLVVAFMEIQQFVQTMLLASCFKNVAMHTDHSIFTSYPMLLTRLKTMFSRTLDMYIAKQANLYFLNKITFEDFKRLFSHAEVITDGFKLTNSAELHYKLIRYAEQFDVSRVRITKAKIESVISKLIL